MTTMTGNVPDVMQVCRNGHVITDLLRTFPERGLNHCDRCGAATLDHCGTCGQPIPGASYVPGMATLGRSQVPQFCPTCGAAFPWTRQTTEPEASPLTVLEAVLRRLPLVIRQLRSRHGDRPPFRVSDEHDLSDLLRALLPLYFDDVRLECRTPSYSADTRTDLLLGPEAIALVLKRTSSGVRAKQLTEQVAEDAAYYARERRCGTLIVFVHDAEARLPEPGQLETALAQGHGDLDVRCVIVS